MAIFLLSEVIREINAGGEWIVDYSLADCRLLVSDGWKKASAPWSNTNMVAFFEAFRLCNDDIKAQWKRGNFNGVAV